jgi:hypothetical protein
VNNIRFETRSRGREIGEPVISDADDRALQALSSSGRRRHLLGSLGAAGLAALAMLGFDADSASARDNSGRNARNQQRNEANAERHRRRRRPGPFGPAGPAGSAGPQGATGPEGGAGPQGSPGPSAGVMSWARVSATGQLVSGYGVDSVSMQVPGIYSVDFAANDQNFNNCAITATTKSFNTDIDVQSLFGSIIFRIGVNGILATDDFSCIVMCPAA